MIVFENITKSILQDVNKLKKTTTKTIDPGLILLYDIYVNYWNNSSLYGKSKHHIYHSADLLRYVQFLLVMKTKAILSSMLLTLVA